MDLFSSYASASGQIINPAKSTVFYGSISIARINQITDLIGFKKVLYLSPIWGSLKGNQKELICNLLQKNSSLSSQLGKPLF